MEFGKSQRAVENRGKWRKLVAQSSVVPPTTLAVKGLAMGGDDDDCLSKRYIKVPEVVFATFCEDYQGKLTTLLEPLHKCKTKGDHVFSYFGSSVLNSLPLHIRNATTINTFKSALKTYLFNLQESD